MPFADAIFGQPDLTVPLAVAAFIPLAQAPEGIAGASMIVAGRYDLRAIFGGLAMALRLVGLAIGVQYGVTGPWSGSCSDRSRGRVHPATRVTASSAATPGLP